MIAKVPVAPQGGGNFARLCAYISRVGGLAGEREPEMTDDRLATEQAVAGDGKQPARLGADGRGIQQRGEKYGEAR